MPDGLAWLYTVFLLSLRLAPVLFLTPLLGVGVVPGAVKSLLVIGLSGLMAGQVSPWISAPSGMVLVVFQAGSALLSGCLLAYGIQVAFAALSLAGRVMDTQMGFGLAGVLNPLARQSTALSGWLLTLLAVAYLHATGGQYVLLRFFVLLLVDFPLGSAVSHASLLAAVKQSGLVFALGVALAAPVMIGLFLLDVGMALISRSMPQFNAFLVSIPVKVAAGLLFLAVLLPQLGRFFERWFTSILHYWSMWPHD